MAFTSTAANAYLKRRYQPKFIENSLTSVSDSILKAVKKETDGSGENWSWLIDADDVFSGAGTLATAQAAATNNSPTVGGRLLSDWFEFSGDAIISASVIGKTRNNDGAWMKAVDIAMKKAMNSMQHANAVFLQGQGWGEVSQISSVSGATFKPTIPSDITKYVKGMPLHFSSSLNADGLRSSTVLYVTAVVYTQGSELVTCSANLSTVSAANSDWAFIADCRQDSATPARLQYIGLGGIFPDQSTTIDASNVTVYGFSRASNSRYYGSFIDASGGGSLLGYLIDGVQEAATIGNASSVELFCSRTVFAQVAKDLQNAVRYDDNPASKGLGTRRLLIYSDGQCEGHLNVSRTTNDTVVWGFDPSALTLKSIGSAPHIDMEDGMTMLRQASAQGYEVRWFQQATLEFANPMAGLRIKVA